MSFLPEPEVEGITPAEAAFNAATRPTGFGEYLGAKHGVGFESSLAGFAERVLTDRPAEGPLPATGTTEEAKALGFDVEQRRITEDEWRKLKLDRPGLEFSGGGTVEYENARTNAHDDKRYRDSLIQNYQGGFLGQAAGFGAMLAGSALSPENFVPFVGPGVRAAMTARMGVVAGHAVTGAADAVLGTAIADAIVLPDLARRGEDVGAADFALDLALGAVVGSAFGTGGGLLARRAERRVAAGVAEQAAAGRAAQERLAPFAVDEDLQTAARAVRLDGVQRQADGLELAMGNLANDEPVDVGAVVNDPVMQQRLIRAYHGSPYRFERFDIGKIDTGEGAQAYGYGLYFAERESIAKGYQTRLAGVDFQRIVRDVYGESDSPDDALDLLLADNRLTDQHKELLSALADDDWLGFDYPHQAVQAALKDIDNFDPSPRTSAAAKGMGTLYAVDLKAGPEDLLDWDKPLSEQSPKVRDALLNHPDPMVAGAAAKWGGDIKTMYDRLVQRTKGGAAAVSKLFREAGIPGIKYLDASSRAEGDGTRNYVMFSDENVAIREVDGRPVDYVTKERVDSPDPSIAAAEASIKRPAPKTPLEAAQRAREEMQVDDPPEMKDVEIMRKQGQLTEADEAMLATTDEQGKKMDSWAAAYEILQGCVIHHG